VEKSDCPVLDDVPVHGVTSSPAGGGILVDEVRSSRQSSIASLTLEGASSLKESKLETS